MRAQVDFHFRLWSSEDHAEFRSLLAEMAKLRILRNAVTHGTWRAEMTLGIGHGDDYLGRPWGDVPAGEKLFWCIRSRQRKGLQEREFSISDVERLANEIAETRQVLADLFRKQTETHPGAGETLLRWPSKTSQIPEV
ncbi:MAG: hypothetical protein ACRDP3_05775 [Streptomyces sp.]